MLATLKEHDIPEPKGKLTDAESDEWKREQLLRERDPKRFFGHGERRPPQMRALRSVDTVSVPVVLGGHNNHSPSEESP